MQVGIYLTSQSLARPAQLDEMFWLIWHVILHRFLLVYLESSGGGWATGFHQQIVALSLSVRESMSDADERLTVYTCSKTLCRMSS